jgi:acetylserotonin N-methyltransferase
MQSKSPRHTLDPDAQVVLDLMDGFRASKAVFTAVALGLFDRLHGRPTACALLAAEYRFPEHTIERLLGACTALGLLSIRNGKYHNRPAADRFLRRQSPESLAGYILYSDRILYRLWTRLADAIRDGTHRWEAEFGQKEGLFDHFFASEEEKRTFLAGMHGVGLLSSPAAVGAFDLSQFRRLVDLGGGTGHLAIAACRKYPDLVATVFDLPAATPVAAEYITQAGLEDRVQTLPGDFFRQPLPPADLYALGRILHDWSEEKIKLLLRKIRESLPAGGGLLICEALLNEESDGPASAYLQSLNMLVCAEGRERTPSEYEALLREAGFREFAFRRTGPPLDIILARK